MYHTRTNKGLTLIELLIVITIIGLLSTVIIASLNKAKIRGRDIRRMKDAEVIYKAVQRFYDDNGHYPCYASGDPQFVYIRSTSDASNNCLIRDLQGYLSSVPHDPGGEFAAAFPYEYQRDNQAQAFYIETTLEKDDYTPEANYPLSGSCSVTGLQTCPLYGYCRAVPRMLGGAGCGFQYILGDTVN